MVERERIHFNINRSGECIRATVETVMSLVHLPKLREAAALEKGVFIEQIKSEGEKYEVVNGKETVRAIVPEGHAQIRIDSTRPSLSTFWNTFEALCEYDQPIPQN